MSDKTIRKAIAKENDKLEDVLIEGSENGATKNSAVQALVHLLELDNLYSKLEQPTADELKSATQAKAQFTSLSKSANFKSPLESWGVNSKNMTISSMNNLIDAQVALATAITDYDGALQDYQSTATPSLEQAQRLVDASEQRETAQYQFSAQLDNAQALIDDIAHLGLSNEDVQLAQENFQGLTEYSQEAGVLDWQIEQSPVMAQVQQQRADVDAAMDDDVVVMPDEVVDIQRAIEKMEQTGTIPDRGSVKELTRDIKIAKATAAGNEHVEARVDSLSTRFDTLQQNAQPEKQAKVGPKPIETSPKQQRPPHQQTVMTGTANKTQEAKANKAADATARSDVAPRVPGKN